MCGAAGGLQTTLDWPGARARDRGAERLGKGSRVAAAADAAAAWEEEGDSGDEQEIVGMRLLGMFRSSG